MKYNYDISKIFIVLTISIVALGLISYEAYNLYEHRYLHHQKKYNVSDDTHVYEVVQLTQRVQDIDIGPYISLYHPPEGQTWELKDFLQAIPTISPMETDYIPNLGFSYGQAYWGHITVTNIDAQSSWFLQLKETLVDHLDLYVISHSTTSHSQLGRFDTNSLRYKKGRYYTKPLTIIPGETLNLFFKVSSTDPFALPFKLYTPEALNKTEFKETAILGLYYGTIICTLFFVMLVLCILKDRTYLYYLNTLFFIHICLAVINNGIFDYVSPINSSWLEKHLVILGLNMGTFFFILFSRNILCRSNQQQAWHRYFNKLLPLPVLTTLSMLFFDDYTSIFIASNVNASIIATAVGIMGFRMIKNNQREALYFMFAWFPFLSTGMITSFTDWGDAPYSYINNYVMQIGMVIEALLLSLVISRQILVARQEKTDALQTAIDNERQARRFKEKALSLEKDMNMRLEERVKTQTQDLTRLVQQLEQHNIELIQISINDGLTQVRNRRFFDEELPILWEKACNTTSSLSLIMLDADHFKQVNDQYGHTMGDECLRVIGKILRQHLTDVNGFVARYGGEEFIITLPDHDLGATRAVAENIRQEIEETPITHNNHTIMITVSLGVANSLATANSDYKTLIEKCDHALYQAKQRGRNKVVSIADTFKIAS